MHPLFSVLTMTPVPTPVPGAASTSNDDGNSASQSKPPTGAERRAAKRARSASPGTSERQESLGDLVKRNMRIVPAPPLSAKAFEQLMEHKELAGHQVSKDRGTFQSTTLDALAETPDELGDAIEERLRCAEGSDGGCVINYFLNINGGRGNAVDDETTTDQLPSVGGWHRDRPSKGPLGRPNTGRYLFYDMIDGREGGLRVRRGAEELEIKVPRGCALYCTNEILQLEHAHGANGRCLSWVIEVSRPTMPTPATKQQKKEASEAQPSLPIREHLDDWKPESMFLGAKHKWGLHMGGGSVWRMAVAWVRGPRLGSGRRRLVSREQANALIEDMSDQERRDAASAQGAMIGALSSFANRLANGATEAQIEETREKLRAAGMASTATAEGMPSGVHWSEALGRFTMSMTDRGELGAAASNAADERGIAGMHFSTTLQRDTMSMTDRSELGAAASNEADERGIAGMHFSTTLQRDTMSMVERGEMGNGEAKARTTSLIGNDRGKGPQICGKCGKLQKGHTCSNPNGPRLENPARTWARINDPDDPTTYESAVQALAAKQMRKAARKARTENE